MTQPHVLFQDIVPYDIPSSLQALTGPASGVLTLPLHIWWGSEPIFDLANHSDLLVAYRSIVREGRTVDQEQLLNPRLLVAVWPELRLPLRCRQSWEEAFPELTA